MFLIPVKILRGKMPSKKLLDTYNMYQFRNFAEAVRTGNLKLFNDTLAEHQEYFIQKGIYLILEQSKLLAYRNLFKRMYESSFPLLTFFWSYLILNTTKMRLQIFEKVFHWMGIDIVINEYSWVNSTKDLDEIECILANLIYQTWIKGYISHQARTLVVSQAKPFPPLSECLMK